MSKTQDDGIKGEVCGVYDQTSLGAFLAFPYGEGGKSSDFRDDLTDEDNPHILYPVIPSLARLTNFRGIQARSAALVTRSIFHPALLPQSNSKNQEPIPRSRLTL